MRRIRLTMIASGALAATLALSACGGDSTAGAVSDATSDSQPTASTAKSRPKGPPLKVVKSRFGRVIADKKGEALYLFTKDGAGPSRCYGACATAWPPFIVKRKPVAAEGANQALIATTKRADGRLQATYAGKPLYYYVDDSPGNILCQAVSEFGGLWYVVKPSGAAVR